MTDRRIVCRCEDVTDRDVADAVAAGLRDVESVKRFTGFGTGICQGSHCMGLALRTLAAALAEAGESAERPLPFTPRPPLWPVPLGRLAGLVPDAEEEGAGAGESEPATARPDHPEATGDAPSPGSAERPRQRSSANSTAAPRSRPTGAG